MSSALLFSAIPFVMKMQGEAFHMEEILAAIRQARKEKGAVQTLFCTFEWDKEIMTTVGTDCGTHILVRDVVETPEFRARVGNVLSKSGKHKCTVLPLEHDLKVLKDEDIVRDEAMLMVVFEPWEEGDAITPGACILRGNKSDEQHVRNKRGVCWHCGGYE